ncbi:MAG: isoprenylcysteine carboxylmethyltransferase family protein [Spartobacteria bacterium]|nr:isoprenylcysteine carboxylmethyltransferase family protein [Spartobacteria bacterium]
MLDELIRQTAAGSENPALFLWGMGLIYLTGLVLLVSVALKFLEHSARTPELENKRRHPFSTREMLIAVLLLFPFWVNSFGQIEMDGTLQVLYFGIGCACVLLAMAWHLRAKIDIRLMWSDGIEIKREHSLITNGAYALSRHPMYASLLLWCWGASLMMFNGITLLLTAAALLPLMVVRAGDEEKELLSARQDYALYRQNVRMLTPTVSGHAANAVKIAAIALFGYLLLTGMSFPGILLLFLVHLYLGYSLKPEKVAFSYRSKSIMMIVLWSLSLLWPPFYYVLYGPLAMFIYGLKFDCPCMRVYSKYHGCPCFSMAGKCLVKGRRGTNQSG